MEIKPIYLVMVTSDNHNKYYKMIPNGSFFNVEYGRVGASEQKRSYPISQWDKKYNEKIKKGYVDHTDLVQDLIHEQKDNTNKSYKEIENSAIADIVNRLQTLAKESVSKNYKVDSNQVTQAMVDAAQDKINKLSCFTSRTTINSFNDGLIELFSIIPRKMRNVNDYLAKTKSDFSSIIKNEQDTLDVMRGQVIQNHVFDDNDIPTDNKEENNNKTILEAMGLVFEPITTKEEKHIKELLGDSACYYKNAWKVTNLATQKRFDEFTKNEHITEFKELWHGSKNENWWSIINTGLVLRPTCGVVNGSMFGRGLYYAPKAKKSIGYTSVNGAYWTSGHSSTGFLAIMEVAYGTPYDVYSHNSSFYNFDYDKLKSVDPNANCLHAHAGAMLKNDEIIIYKEEQCTIKYLVEIKN